MKNRYSIVLAIASMCCLATTNADARGFGGGGFHGGGGGGFHGGGGFGGGGFDRGGFSGGGGFDRGGFSGGGGFDRGGFGGGGGFDRGGVGGGPGGFDRGAGAGFDRGGIGGGFDRGAAGAGGWDRGNFGQAPSRSGLNSFLGLPSDEGFHGLSSGFDVNKGVVDGPRGGTAAGISVEGPRGNEAARGVAKGPRGGVAAGGGVRGADGGVAGRGIAVGPDGRVAGGEAVRGSGGYGAGRGFVAGPRGAAAGFSRVTPTDRYATGVAVRNNFHDWGIYGRGWYDHHPGAWFAAGWAAGAAWDACTWGALGSWFGYADAAPIDYDYGGNVTYDNDNVYVDGQDVGSSDEYYQQAQSLAATGSQDDVSNEGDWLPLGVFALCRAGHDKSTVSIQLAVNKQGIVRGNYTDTFSDKPMAIEGSVDKKTQRVAFTVADRTTTVFETGLYNLTKDEAPILIHFGKDRTEQWMLVRLKQPDTNAPSNDS